jgi:hypothetical protein
MPSPPPLGTLDPAEFRFLSAIWEYRAKHGNGRGTLRVFEVMVREGNMATYVGILSACSHAEMLNGELRCFDDVQMTLCCTWTLSSARCKSSPSCFDDMRTMSCCATASSKLLTSRVSTTSISDTASSAPMENVTASMSSEVQALQELRQRFMLQDMPPSAGVIPNACGNDMT